MISNLATATKPLVQTEILIQSYIYSLYKSCQIISILTKQCLNSDTVDLTNFWYICVGSKLGFFLIPSKKQLKRNLVIHL